MKRASNNLSTQRLVLLTLGAAVVLSCGGNDNTLPINNELFGTYRRISYWKNLNICTTPQFEIDLAQANDFVRFERRDTDIGDYMGYRNCAVLDDAGRCCQALNDDGTCVPADVELLYAELRNKSWLAKRRVAIQYPNQCALQFVQSTISRGPLRSGELLRMDTFTYSGVVERPEGTTCDASMAEELFDQLNCIAHTDSFIERVDP